MNEITVQIDQAGRLVLPKSLRERFHLRGGDRLSVEVRADTIELRPTQNAGRLARVNGVLVYTGPEAIRTETDLAGNSREERIADLRQ